VHQNRGRRFKIEHAASILRKIAIAFHYGATAIAAAFFLMSFCWIGGFLGLLVET
jgi:hypothetical protein